jgi:hypothetical protein
MSRGHHARPEGESLHLRVGVSHREQGVSYPLAVQLVESDKCRAGRFIAYGRESLRHINAVSRLHRSFLHVFVLSLPQGGDPS